MDLRDDLRLAVRRLRHQPGFAVVAVLTLALGLGANTAIFTLVHALMLRSLPVERPGELYRLGDTLDCCVNSGLAGSYSLFSVPLFDHLREATAEDFTSLAGFQANTTPVGVRRKGAGVPESLQSQFVTGTYFRTFGVEPAAGRLLTVDDDRPGAAPVAVLSHQAWTRSFGADPSVVGDTFVVNGTPVTVVGVTARGFYGEAIRPTPAGVWVPLAQERLLRGAASLIDRGDQNWLYAIGRLRAGVRVDGTSAKVTSALRRWLSAQPFVSDGERATLGQQHVTVVPAGGGVGLMRAQFGQPLIVLFATSALVLLVAVANLANLLLARADRGQAAMRAALGASSARLVRQALVEGVLLALIGGAVGVMVSVASIRALVAMAFPGVGAVPIAATPSGAVLLFAVVLAVATGALFTAAPAWAMSRTPPLEALSGVGRGGHTRSFVPRRSLVVAQVALSLVLLSSAGLLAASLGNLERQPLGFEPAQRVVIRVDPPAIAGQTARLERLYEGARQGLLRVSGVRDASYALYGPMEGNNWSSRIAIAGRTSDPGQPDGSSWNRVGPRYFETTGTRVLRGRLLDERDTATARRVAVVNDAFRRQFFPDSDPIGKQFGIGDASHARDYEIVGVVEDVKYTGPTRPPRPMFFMPAFQSVDYGDPSNANVQARSMLLRSFVVRIAPGARDLERAFRQVLAAVDPDLTVSRVLTMNDQVDANFRIQRLMARLTSFYGLLALGLASLGLYGVTAYSVSRRIREIGVRMALGADRANVIRSMLAGPLVQTLIGLAIGLPLALASSGVIGSQLYGITARDPRTLVVATAVLLGSGLLAAAPAAIRAASIDPARALRAE